MAAGRARAAPCRRGARPTAGPRLNRRSGGGRRNGGSRAAGTCRRRGTSSPATSETARPVLWFTGRTIRATTVSARGRGGAELRAQSLLDEPSGERRFGTATAGRLGGPSSARRRTTTAASSGRSRAGWPPPNSLALVTISFDDDGDRGWALETWRSLAHEPGLQPARKWKTHCCGPVAACRRLPPSKHVRAALRDEKRRRLQERRTV